MKKRLVALTQAMVRKGLKAGQLQPAAVLMDINIPKMDRIAAGKDSKDVKTIWFRERKRGSYEHSRKSCVRV